MFTSSIKRQIRHFPVVVVQWRQRNAQKSVMHVQSCCFAYSSSCCFDVLVVFVAGENIRFSSLFPAEDGEERGETDAGKSEDKQRMFSQAIAVVASLSP